MDVIQSKTSLFAEMKGGSMRKIINDGLQIVSEMMEGFCSAYHKFYTKHPEVNGIIGKQRRRNKVSLVIGGGSGHEPMFSGFVGRGLADAAACGNIFASPDPKTIYETAKAVEDGKGVLFVYGCYAGDNLNFDMGEEFLNADGIPTAHVRVWDDVASAPPERIEDRRGIAGDVFVVKIAGAACDSGVDLEEAVRITQKARDNTRSIGVATAPAQLPGADSPIFELGEDEIEYGMGLHGEKGVLRTKWQPADKLVEQMYTQIKEDMKPEKGCEVCVLVNGLGSTTLIELSIVFRRLKQLLDEDGIRIYDSELNSYCTSQEMGGFSITLMKLDDELKNYYDMPCQSPFYARGILDTYTETADSPEPTGTPDSKASEETDKIPQPQDVYVRKEHYENLTAQDCRQMLLYVADKIIQNEDFLTKIDSEIGDGDHGIGMAAGMKKAKEKLETMYGEENVYALFEAAGKEMLLSMGGASGVIFGSLFLEGAKAAEPKAVLEAQDFLEMEIKSLQAIKERGKAEVGDKTMVDALSLAVEGMQKTCHKGLPEMLKAAEEYAAQGVENTKNCVARFGRAKSLGERALGYQDAGATSTWLIFQGIREFVDGSME